MMLQKAIAKGRIRNGGACLVSALLCGFPAAVGAQVGAVSGMVWDSTTQAPLVDAAVVIWQTPYRAETDSLGRYRIRDIPPGNYNILFFHERLGRLGVSVGPTPISVSADEEVHADLYGPSESTVVRSQCMAEAREPGAGAVSGLVVDSESGMAIGGATVHFSWDREGSPTPVTIDATSDNQGRFRSCVVPGDTRVLVRASFPGRASFARQLTVRPEDFTSIDVPLVRTRASRVTARIRDAQSGDAVEGAEVWLGGTAYRALSDGGGQLVFDAVPPGEYMMLVDHLGYGTKMDTLVVPNGQRIVADMLLDTRPIEIAPLTVTTEAPPVEMARRRGGIVITRDQIDEVRQRSRDASDVIRSLHIPGVLVRHSSNGTICVGYTTGQVKMNQTGCVEMMIYINDVRATDSDLALRLPPDAIERMVLYKPVDAGNLFGLGGGNGVWMIYTRGN